MNIDRFRYNMAAAETVQKILGLAGQSYETAFSQLKAVSDKQRDFGEDVRILALANIWDGVDKEYKTPEFAKALIRATNRHTDATWWINRESHTLAPSGFKALDEDIDEELS